MSLKRDLLYPGRFDNATPEQPQGAFKNRTSDTSKDGSYLERDWLNDFSALFSSLLTVAKIEPNGLVDSVGASQYFEALQKISTANNNIKTSQFVVNGNTGNDLPVNGALKSYSIGDELALGWVAVTAVTDATKDVNGNVTAASGTVRYTINKDESNSVGTMYGSVMTYDGSDYTQRYNADTTGLTVGSDASSWWLDVDLSLVSGLVFGLSESLGKLPVLSVNDVEIGARGGFLLISNSSGFVRIFPDGYKEQYSTVTTGVNGLVNLPFLREFEDLATVKVYCTEASATGWGSPAEPTAYGPDTAPSPTSVTVRGVRWNNGSSTWDNSVGLSVNVIVTGY